MTKNLFCIEKNQQCYYIPYTGKADLNQGNLAAKNAIIFVHGILKDSTSICRNLQEVMPSVLAKSTLVICPQFLTPGDVSKSHYIQKNILAWPFESWDQGSNSINTSNTRFRISSFKVLDSLVENFSDRSKYPNMKNIIILGFSAGAQLIQRYAALSTVDQYINKNRIALVFEPATLYSSG